MDPATAPASLRRSGFTTATPIFRSLFVLPLRAISAGNIKLASAAPPAKSVCRGEDLYMGRDLMTIEERRAPLFR